LYASGYVGGRQFCLLGPALAKWGAGKAVRLTGDLDIDLTGKGGSIISGGIQAEPLPIDDMIREVAYATPLPQCPEAIPILLALIAAYRASRASPNPTTPRPGTPPTVPFADRHGAGAHSFAPGPTLIPGLPGVPKKGPTFTCPVPGGKAPTHSAP